MWKIESLAQYNQLIDRAEQQGFSLTNCFFLPAAVQKKVEDGTLYGLEVDSGLLLLDDNGGFYRCYYYLSPKGKPDRLTLDKNAVIEFPFNGEMGERQRQQVSLIDRMGFRLGRESGMMSAAPTALIGHGQAQERCSGAQSRDAEGIMALLTGCFNPMYAFLPDRKALSDAIDQGRVLVVREGDRVAAALVSGFEKRIATVNQVAVDPDYRRRGYAGALMHTYHSLYVGRAASFRHWVDINNVPAVNMYLGLGYTFSLRRANEYIM